MVSRACTYQMPSGRPCRATPLRDAAFCFWHAPETAEEAAEARRLGGMHRRKKKTVASIYDFRGLRTIEDHQALLETAATETLALENSISRNRVIAQIVSAGAKLLEVGELEERLRALEAIRKTPSGDETDAFGDGRW